MTTTNGEAPKPSGLGGLIKAVLVLGVCVYMVGVIAGWW